MTDSGGSEALNSSQNSLQSRPDDIVVVENLRKEFKGHIAVEDVSMRIAKGEIVGLLGANGAGKTTALQILLGLISRSGGVVKMFGLDPETHRTDILGRCNFSSAYVALPYNLRVWENLKIFAELYCVKNSKSKIQELMEMFGISHLKDRLTGALSSGESTRLNLCKALLNDPELLLLDEPTASLDPDIADKVRKLLKSVQKQKGITILSTSHNMRDMQELCDRILFLHKGKIIAEGTAEEIMAQFERESLEDVFIRIARSGEVEPA